MAGIEVAFDADYVGAGLGNPNGALGDGDLVHVGGDGLGDLHRGEDLVDGGEAGQGTDSVLPLPWWRPPSPCHRRDGNRIS